MKENALLFHIDSKYYPNWLFSMCPGRCICSIARDAKKIDIGQKIGNERIVITF